MQSGAIDQDFDGDSGTGNGVVHGDLTPGSDLATSITVDGQGRIVLAGHAGNAPGVSDAGVARFLPDGRLDKSFAGDGTLAWDTPVEVSIWDVAVQGDGKVLVAGGWGSYPTIDTIVQRFKENGTLDTFGPGGSGRKIMDMGGMDQATSIALQPGGQVLVGSSSSAQDTLVRLTSGGEIDTSFESGGELPVPLAISTVALAPDGKIVLGGWGSIDGLDAFAVQRLSADGAPDATFAGGSPVLHRAVAGEGSGGVATVVAPDGKIVSVGSTGSYPDGRGVIMRLKGQPDPDAPPASPASPTGATLPADPPLTLSGVRLTNRLFTVGRATTSRVGKAQAAAARRRGTAFVFRLSHAATVSIRIKRSGKRVALLKRTAQAGGNRVRFSGRVGRRALGPAATARRSPPSTRWVGGRGGQRWPSGSCAARPLARSVELCEVREASPLALVGGLQQAKPCDVGGSGHALLVVVPRRRAAQTRDRLRPSGRS